jgi:hypothetical protein
MKMSKKELIEKLRKIYHNLKPELKQSDPHLLAKHIAGVFQRAEPKFDFQRAEPGGSDGKRLMQIIMILLAAIAATGETMPLNPDLPPSCTPTDMPSSSNPPPSCTPTDMPSSSNTASISDDQKQEIHDELIQARQRLVGSVERQLAEDRPMQSRFLHTYIYSHEVSPEDIREYHRKEQNRYKDLLQGLFGKDKFRKDTYNLVKIIPLTEVTLDSLRINPEFLNRVEYNQPVDDIIETTVIQLSDQLGGLTEADRKEIMKRATNYVKQKTKTFLLDLPFFSYDEDTKDGKVTKDQLLEKMRGVIGKHMKDILKGSAQGNIRKLAALYLAANSQEILMKLHKDGPERTKAHGLQYTNPTIEESKYVLQHWLLYDFPNDNHLIIQRLLRENVENRVDDIFEMADDIRGLLDQTSRYLLDEFDSLKKERDSATFNRGRTAEDKDSEPKLTLLDQLMENLQKFITTVTQTATLAVGAGIAGSLLTVLGVIYCAMQGKRNNNNRLQDRPRPGDQRRKPTTRRRRAKSPRTAPRVLRDQSPRRRQSPRVLRDQSPRTATRRRRAKSPRTAPRVLRDQSPRRRQSPRVLRDRVRPTYN